MSDSVHIRRMSPTTQWCRFRVVRLQSRRQYDRLIVVGGAWSVVAAVLLPAAYVLDCLDGQLARYTGKMSAIGDYLDNDSLITEPAMALKAAVSAAES